MTESKKRLGSDLAKVDVHEIAREEYEEIPELTKADFARGVVNKGGRPVGRPRLSNPKQAVKLRLSPAVLAYFRSTGPGWQTRINATLERVARGELTERRSSRTTATKRK
jgi:uncharacterized protein (DUF4415 family)